MQTQRILSSFPSFHVCDSSLPTVRNLPPTTFRLLAYVIHSSFCSQSSLPTTLSYLRIASRRLWYPLPGCHPRATLLTLLEL